MWKNPSRMHVYKWGLLKVRKGNTKGAQWVAGRVHWQSECAFLFQVLLKPTLTQGRPRRSPPNNEWDVRGMGGSPSGEGGLGHPQAISMSPKRFLLLACLTTNNKSAGRGMGGPWARWGWFELSLSEGVNNLHTFANEKKLREREGCSIWKTTLSHIF
jgi:hypothetical protein